MLEKKEIHLALEWFAKCEKEPTCKTYATILEALDKAALCSKTSFTCKQISLLAGQAFDVQGDPRNTLAYSLGKAKEAFFPPALGKKKKGIMQTFFAANFPEKKVFLEESSEAFLAQLSPVETKMYQLLHAYLFCMEEALDFFALLDTSKEASFEGISAYVLALHEDFLALLFYKQERELVAQGLGKMALVLAGVYYQDLYM